MVACSGRWRGVVVARGARRWRLGGSGARRWRHGGAGHGVVVAQGASSEIRSPLPLRQWIRSAPSSPWLDPMEGGQIRWGWLDPWRGRPRRWIEDRRASQQRIQRRGGGSGKQRWWCPMDGLAGLIHVFLFDLPRRAANRLGPLIRDGWKNRLSKAYLPASVKNNIVVRWIVSLLS